MKRILLLVMVLVALVALPVLASQGQASDTNPDWMLGFLVGGMVINAANISAMFKSFNTIFNAAVAAATPQYPKIAMIVPSTTRSNNYAWMAALPKMREWIGDRFIKNLKVFIYEILNKTWESTVRVPREDVEDDQYSVFGNVVQAYALTGAAHPDELVFGLLNNAFTTGLSYDDYAFCSASHASGSNKGVAVLSDTNYAAARAVLRAVKDDAGKPIYTGSEKITLVVGAALEGTAKKILVAENISVTGGSTETNIWKGSAELLISPLITSATAWFLLVEFNGLKALVFQKRRELKFTQITDPDSPEVFKTNSFDYGIDARYNAGYGLHQLCYGSTGAGA